MLKSSSRVSEVPSTQHILQCIVIPTLTIIGRGLNMGLITHVKKGCSNTKHSAHGRKAKENKDEN